MSSDTPIDLLADPPPSPARVADALTRGLHHFPTDRAIAQRLQAADPTMDRWVVAHHQFRTEAMLALARAGIRQWLHLGCGMPNAASAYTLLDKDPDLGRGRLVCVDDDPCVIAYLRAGGSRANRDLKVTTLRASFEDPHQLMEKITCCDGVDLGEPVAILLTGVLHHVSGPTAAALLTALRETVTTGSYVALSHPSSPSPMTTQLAAAITHYEHATGTIWTLRGPETAPYLLGRGWTPLPPGITAVGRWHPIPPLYDEDDPVDNDPLNAVAGWAVLAAASPPP